MSDGALEATESQFIALLDSASGGISIRLSLYSMPGVPRGEAAARRISNFYTRAESLGDMKLDGLIVTGREPLTPNLADEPYWESFKATLDWAEHNTYSTIWSCLAAHAAVQYVDNIARVRNHVKHSGILECARISDHSLTEGTPSRFKVPHSRWNGLPEEELVAHGYQVLSRSEDAGVDAFCRREKSLFLFFQGHPEYESTTLMLEYRRDVARYLRGESENYPSMPRGYFDGTTMAQLKQVEMEAIANRHEMLQKRVSATMEGVTIDNTWRSTAAGIYRNWLCYILAQKNLGMQEGDVSALPPRGADTTPVLAAVRALR
jgi:homoserine O-succinyltransferase